MSTGGDTISGEGEGKESHSVAVHFVDFTNLGNIDKLVDQTLAVNLGKDSSLVVIPEISKS